MACGFLLAGCASPILFVARVYDAEVGKPLPGALVLVDNTGMMAAADSTGRTPAIRAVPGMTVSVNEAGYLPAAFSIPRSGTAAETASLDAPIYPDRPRTVQGLVIDAGSKTGCGEAVVSIAGTNSSVGTGSGGSYSFSSFPPGRQLLTAVCTGFEAKTAEVTAPGSETTQVDFFLRDTTNEGSLDGHVFLAGSVNPVPGATVSIKQTGLEGLTDSSGYYCITRVPAGEHVLKASALMFHTDSVTFRVVKGWSVTVDIELRHDSR